MLFGQDVCAVTDDLITRSGGIAGIAQINSLDMQAMLAGVQQQATDRVAAAGIVVIDVF